MTYNKETGIFINDKNEEIYLPNKVGKLLEILIENEFAPYETTCKRIYNYVDYCASNALKTIKCRLHKLTGLNIATYMCRGYKLLDKVKMI
ncbi:MAG: hypothetical protein J6B87_02985 [Clostridia bacterium]|nr:hypothetical protein [Clostridia bacterium]